MKILIGNSGSGKTTLVLKSYPDTLISYIESNDEFRTYAQASEVGQTVLLNIYNRFDFKVLKDYIKHNIFIEFHRGVKIPKEYSKYVVKVEANLDEIEKFCGKRLTNWHDAIRYKKYGIYNVLPKKRSELYYIKKFDFRYIKLKGSGWLNYEEF